jgi:hypothetical protein
MNDREANGMTAYLLRHRSGRLLTIVGPDCLYCATISHGQHTLLPVRDGDYIRIFAGLKKFAELKQIKSSCEAAEHPV